ncbi:MAG: hypothetical protein ACXV5F_06305 [Halobacteriota archaeon]
MREATRYARQIAPLAFIVIVAVSVCAGGVVALPLAAAETAQTTTVQSRCQVAGPDSQGIAYDGAYTYLFETTAILKLNASYALVDANRNVATNVGINHLGAGCYYDGKLYVACCNFASCSDWNSGRIGIWSTAPGLPFVGFIDISDQAFDPSAITIDAATGHAYVSSYCSNEVHLYDINHGWAHTSTITPAPAFTSTQGIAYYNNHLYVSQQELGVVRTDLKGTNQRTILPLKDVNGSELEGLYVDGRTIEVVNKPYIYTYVNQWGNLP